MGLYKDKYYSAKEINDALVGLGFTVLKCEASDKNFLVQVSGGPNQIENTGVSLSLSGQKGGAGGLIGQYGISGISETKLNNQ